ncbi:hypothetical protein GHT06_010872 [Daphnia sinensis]|uniref:CUB domain-containing protein n=1 Tax=Daphnia sinensis TaxID=1820382 RepID=A0AAD5L197_9CRUS|nr:hypothetical protein GHT06_010872 [Daphnia sinensis]
MPPFMQIGFLFLVFGWSACFQVARLDAAAPMGHLANGYNLSGDRGESVLYSVDNEASAQRGRLIANALNVPRFKQCRDREARTENGTITPYSIARGEWRSCSFKIMAADGQRMHLSCSVVQLTHILSVPPSSLRLKGVVGVDVNPPSVNKTYTSIGKQVVLFSQLGDRDWFECSWTARTAITTRQEPVPSFQTCRDKNSTAGSGVIQPFVNSTDECVFSITAPSGQRIEIACSIVNFTYFDSWLRLESIVDIAVWIPATKRVYITVGNQIKLYARLRQSEWFDCKWTTVDSVVGQPRYCHFSIIAPIGYQFEISCPALNLTSVASYMRLEFIAQTNVSRPERNKVYTSIDESLRLESRVDNSDWFQCNWITIPKKTTQPTTMTMTTPTTTSQQPVPTYYMCRENYAAAANGIIRPLDNYTAIFGDGRYCNFRISAPVDQFVQISCSIVNTSTSLSLQVLNVLDVEAIPPILNRVYSSKTYYVDVYSRLRKPDWFSCRWTTIPAPPSTMTDYKFCRHGMATTTNGTLRLIDGMAAEEWRFCFFYILAPVDHQIQFSCSAVQLTANTSIFSLDSTALIGDRIDCNWTSIPAVPELTSQFKLCRHGEATSSSGTIQPLGNTTRVGQMMECMFSVIAPMDEGVQMVCSDVSLMSSTSYLGLKETVDVNVYKAVNNRVYTSGANMLHLFSRISIFDWFDCKWTTIASLPANATDFKLCRDKETRTYSNGTIQPFDGVLEESRECWFNIIAPSNRKEIQISCQFVNLTSTTSYLKISGIKEYVVSSPLLNKIYISDVNKQISVRARLSQRDWFVCNWVSV